MTSNEEKREIPNDNGAFSINKNDSVQEEEIIRDEFLHYRISEVSRAAFVDTGSNRAPNGDIGKDDDINDDESKDLGKNDEEDEDGGRNGKSGAVELEERETNSLCSQEPARTKFEMDHVASNRSLESVTRFLKSTYLGEMPLYSGGGTWDKSRDDRLFFVSSDDKDGDGRPKVQHVPIPERDLQKDNDGKAADSKISDAESKHGTGESKEGWGEGKVRDSDAASESKESKYDSYRNSHNSSRDYK